MRSTRPLVLLSALLLALVPVSAQAQDRVIEESEGPGFLFVLSAASGSIGNGSLTLLGVPGVIYSSDRPARISGHRSVTSLVAGWDQGDDSFAADPPIAVLSLRGVEAPEDVIIELTSAEHDGDALRFGFTVVEGSPTEGAFGPASLSIDEVRALAPITRSGSADLDGPAVGPLTVDVRRWFSCVVVSGPGSDCRPWELGISR